MSFSSITEFLEISCPTCRIACEYSLIDKDDGLFKAHDWNADIDSLPTLNFYRKNHVRKLDGEFVKYTPRNTIVDEKISQ